MACTHPPNSLLLSKKAAEIDEAARKAAADAATEAEVAAEAIQAKIKAKAEQFAASYVIKTILSGNEAKCM